MTDSLVTRIEEIPPRLLLPHGGPSPHRLHVLDALSLPASEPPAWLGVAVDDSDRCHTLPLVDDALRPRRARAGDGWAAAVVALASASSRHLERGWRVRVVAAAPAETLTGALTEEPLSASSRQEVVEVAGAYRVRVVLEPQLVTAPVLQPWRHLGAADPALVDGAILDVVWEAESGDQGYAPMVLVGRAMASVSIAERLNREVTRHLRGVDTVASTIGLAEALGGMLARFHLALATPSAECPQPTRPLDADAAAVLERRVKDVLSEAMVLTDTSIRELIRSHLDELRSSFAELASAGAALALPQVPLGSLEQFVVDGDGDVRLDPLLLVPSPSPQLAVMDLARIFREVTHVAHGALRRMVNGGEDVPAERVPTWVRAVREAVGDSYRSALAAGGRSELCDDHLLRAFEIEAECLALVYASRELPTWSAVPDAGLAELLTPWRSSTP